MKKLLIMGALGMGLMYGHTAMAGVQSSVGKTTCYTFKKDKLIDKAKCDFYMVEGANSMYPMYGFEDYSVKTPKMVIHVENSTSCESENDCETTHTVNDKEAKSSYRSIDKGYKVISNKVIEKMPYQQLNKRVLTCDKTKDGALEICTPFSKDKKSADEPPAWTQKS